MSRDTAAAVRAWGGLVHYAADPVTLDRGRRYMQDPAERPFGKPNGLWVSVPGQGDWESWCIREDYRIDKLAVAHAVTLRSGADVLFIGDPEGMDSFDAEYRSTAAPGSIDWDRVTRRHDGIVIAPHRWDRRNQLDWYWAWDCASGCIWNLDAINRFVPLE